MVDPIAEMFGIPAAKLNQEWPVFAHMEDHLSTVPAMHKFIQTPIFQQIFPTIIKTSLAFAGPTRNADCGAFLLDDEAN